MTSGVKLDHVNFTVSSFDESARWYQALFGFEVVEDQITDGIRWGVLRSGETMLCIYENPDYQHLDRFQLAESSLHGMAHFALRIADPETWLAAAQKLGVEIMYDGVVRWPHSQSWYVKDPTGYEIEVVKWDDEVIVFD